MSTPHQTASTLPGSFHPSASSSRPRKSAPSQVEADWEDEDNSIEQSMTTLASPRPADETSTTGRSPRRPSSRTTTKSPGRASPSTPTVSAPNKGQRTPVRRREAARLTTVPLPPRSRLSPPAPPAQRSSHPAKPSTLLSTLSLLVSSLKVIISITHLLLRPFIPYILLALIFSAAVLYLPPRIPSFLFKVLGYMLHSVSSSWLDSLSFWPSLTYGDRDIALAQGLALLPLRSLATPACALIGLACNLSLLSQTDTEGKYVRMAQPIWKSSTQTVDVGAVARNLTKDVKGAKDIFESIALLSEGGMMDRLEYVRIWELGAAVSIGSNLEDKDMVARQLLELGDDSRDLSDELVDINAMAVNAFTWIQWEFSGLVKALSLPPSQRQTPSVLADSLNNILNRLHSALGDLHRSASRANVVASRGSEKGRQVRDHLRSVGASLARESQLQPGWKHAVDRAGHFFVGGEPTKSELLARDLAITEVAISSLGDLVRGLEHSRSSIKGFRDQIGYFDASMMGFHLGASEAVGLGPEEEVRVLGEVVEEFGRAIGRARERGLPESEAVLATRIEGDMRV